MNCKYNKSWIRKRIIEVTAVLEGAFEADVLNDLLDRGTKLNMDEIVQALLDEFAD